MTLINLKGMVANVTTRREVYQDREHIVAPAIILTEGVRNQLLYPAEELEKFVQAWNGVPVPVQHPEDVEGNALPANSPDVMDENVVGTFFNAYFEDGAIKGEIWLDVAKTKQIAPEVLDIINSNDRILEVSTGLYLEEIEGSGTWSDGEEYVSTAINYRPEHLALLPGGVGACNASDGCGVRDNNDNLQQGGGDVVPGENEKITQLADNDTQKDKGLFSKFAKLGKMFGFKTQEASHDDIRRKLQSIVDEKDVPSTTEEIAGSYHYVMDVFDNYFVYTMHKSGDVEAKLFKQDFTVNDKEEVELEGEPIEVRLKTEYVTLSESGEGRYEEVHNKEDKNIEGKGDVNMCCEKLVAELIENENTQFTDIDKEWLMTMEEDQLNKLKPAEVKVKEKKVEEKVEENKEDAKVVDTKDEDVKPITLEEILENSGEYKDAIKDGLKMHKEKRANMIKSISENKDNIFSEEELKEMGMEQLEKVAALAKVKADPDYALNKGEENKDDEIKLNEKQEDGTGIPDIPVMTWNKDMSPDFSALN